MKTLVAVIISSLLLAACGTTNVVKPVAGERVRAVPSALPASGATPSPWCDSLLAAMSIEQKVGQMVMVTVPTVYQSDGSKEFRRAKELITDSHVGGLIALAGDVYGGTMMFNKLQRAADLPLLVAADLEHGLAMRLDRGTDFPEAMALGAGGVMRTAFLVGKATAEEARAVGIHMNLAPVVDVNTNPRNPVINTRSFGDDVRLVNAMAGAYIRGEKEGGVLATVKHFPGHGSTGEDSHLRLPVVNASRARLDTVEFAAFRSAVSNGVDAVMVGHLAVPAVDSTGLPSSLSRPLIEGVLRKELGFNGIVITDAMGMAGVRAMSPGRAAVAAIRAGVDILLLTDEETATIKALCDAVRSGEIPIARIDSSVHKILAAKQRLGLDRARLVDPDSVGAHVGTLDHWRLAQRVAEEGVTVVKNQHGILPLSRQEWRHGVLLILTDVEDSRTAVNRQDRSVDDEPTGAYLTRLLQRRNFKLETIRLSPASPKSELERAVASVASAGRALIATFFRVRTSSGRIGVPEEFDPLVRQLNALQTPLVTLSFGDPYVIEQWSGPQGILCAYSDAEVMTEAAVAVLCGEHTAGGRLPVSVGEKFPNGTGVLFGVGGSSGDEEEDHGYPRSTFAEADSLIECGIRDSVFPGAQLVVLKDGCLAYRQHYGRQTYDDASPLVTDSTIFDLASLTKVTATTPAVMKLYEEGRLDLGDSVWKFLPEFAVGEKKNVTIRHLLLHRSGLPPFRKLWELASSPSAALDSALATPLVARPGDTTIYSDLGMMALGRIIEKVTQRPLARYVDESFFQPLGMRRTTYNPAPGLREDAAPTEFDKTWRHRLIKGTVHDENAAALGGISGHAGLFSTASDLSLYVRMLMNGGFSSGVRYLAPSTIHAFVAEQVNGSDRWLGWDRKSPQGSSAGTLFSERSYGHTGFTGTSIWVDPVRRLAVILLTNRVYPTREHAGLQRVRPLVYDAVVRAVAR